MATEGHSSYILYLWVFVRSNINKYLMDLILSDGETEWIKTIVRNGLL